MSKACAFWFIRDGFKLLQCSKEDFDKAIIEGKSVKYGCYADKKSERIADELEASRVKLLANPDVPPKFRAVLTNPKIVIDAQVVNLMDTSFWVRESKNRKYKK
jgi:hypothetical protein